MTDDPDDWQMTDEMRLLRIANTIKWICQFMEAAEQYTNVSNWLTTLQRAALQSQVADLYAELHKLREGWL
jgi:hypothetical protein